MKVERVRLGFTPIALSGRGGPGWAQDGARDDAAEGAVEGLAGCDRGAESERGWHRAAADLQVAAAVASSGAAGPGQGLRPSPDPVDREELETGPAQREPTPPQG
jgi:hypothetical protein